MNLIDLIIIFLLVAAAIRGSGIGSLRQIFSTSGFFAGFFTGAWLAPKFAKFAHTSFGRSWVTLLIIVGTTLLFLGIGEYIGNWLKAKLKQNWAHSIDHTLGAIIGGLTFLALIWFAAGVLVDISPPGLQNQLRDSAIISFLDKSLPPTPGVIADISHVIEPNGFPKVFEGIEPAPLNPNTPIPNMGELTSAVQKDRQSVVKIEGIGCGGIVEGSGFIVSPGYVATNAHVVAGVAHPYVIDANGRHVAQAVWFDPDLDLAILTTSGLAGQPLHINASTVANGTVSAVLGYPGGGDFNPQPAVVLDNFLATGRNIYGQDQTIREVYEIKATVIPGNSGGPLVGVDGSVIGVIFASSTSYNQVGYALTTAKVISEINQADQLHQLVATGACAQ